MTPFGAYRHAHVAQGSFFHRRMPCVITVVSQEPETAFVLDKSKDFTQAGVERLNDPIRTYVWAILGAKAQTRSNILKTGTGFDAQKKFLADTEDAIASPVDIPYSISRYQKTLQYAPTPLDFGVWDRAPSVAERHETPFGQYPGVQQRDPDSRIGRGYRTQPWDKRGRAHRLQRRLGIPRNYRLTSRDRLQGAAAFAKQDENQRSRQRRHASGETTERDAHKEKKTALVAVGVAGGLAALWLSSR